LPRPFQKQVCCVARLGGGIANGGSYRQLVSPPAESRTTDHPAGAFNVTSVSKTSQTLSLTASAIFVITAEDIRRSGATSIPDLLRMVPGVDVAQINANTWAISAHGFNGRFSNELLVLLDGRNVYTPTFGGVFCSCAPPTPRSTAPKPAAETGSKSRPQPRLSPTEAVSAIHLA